MQRWVKRVKANVKIEKRVREHTNKGYQLGQSSGRTTLNCCSVWSDKPRLRYQQVSTNLENINPKIIQIQPDSYSGNHTGASTLAELNNGNKTGVLFSHFLLLVLCCTVNQGSCWPTRLVDVMSVFLQWSGITRILFPVISAYSSKPLPSSLKCWTLACQRWTQWKPVLFSASSQIHMAKKKMSIWLNSKCEILLCRRFYF